MPYSPDPSPGSVTTGRTAAVPGAVVANVRLQGNQTRACYHFAPPEGETTARVAPARSPDDFAPLTTPRDETFARQACASMRTAIPTLSGSFPLLDEDQIETATNDAILDHIRKSQDSPDPTLLYSAAWRNCRDIAQSETRRKAREREWSEEYLPRSGIQPIVATDKTTEEFVERIADLMPDDDMRATFRLWLAGERTTVVYAARLGKEGSSARAHMNREKNRLRMFLRRNLDVRRLAYDFLRGGR